MAGKKITDLTVETDLSDNHYIITQNYISTDETKRTPLSLLKTFLSIVGIKDPTNSTAERFNHYNFSDSSYTAGDYSHTEGFGTKASGYGSHSEGDSNTSSGSTAHSEGHNTVASGASSHTEGDGTQAVGSYGHAEGYYTIARYVGHAEGWQTQAINTGHAEGDNTTAVGYGAHSEGRYTTAIGEASHAGGYYTTASGDYQTVIGKFNVSDTSSLFIIGCGTSDTERKNAFIVDADGNVTILGTVKAEGGFEGIEGGGTINVWASETDYSVDDIILNEDTLYKCNTEHTSDDTFDSTYWTALTGSQGEAGVTPHIDEETKHWILGETDTGVLAEGTKGDDGVTPHIDETTKHWFVGEEDTGVVAEGTTTVTTTAVVYTGTLTADGWVGDTVPYTQAVTISGIDETSRPVLYPVLSDEVETGLSEQKAWGYITKAVTSADTITFSCYKTKPTVDISFEAEVR